MNAPGTDKILLTGDWHFTNNREDSYRFNIFNWLIQKQKEHGIERLVLLGDLTDKKDDHPSTLVNPTVRGFKQLSEVYKNVDIVKGNHDYYDPDRPYFEFLSSLQNIKFHSTPYIGNNDIFFPHFKTPEEFEQAFVKIIRMARSGPLWLFMHQTFNGAKASNGFELEGFSQKLFLDHIKSDPFYAYSGDIHVPQKLGSVDYIGSPYHVHYGDNFNPRLLLITRKNNKLVEQQDLYFDAPRKVAIKIKDPKEVKDIDFGNCWVKVEVYLEKDNIYKWKKISKKIETEIKANGGTIKSIYPIIVGELDYQKHKENIEKTKKQWFDEYCDSNSLVNTHLRKTGEDILTKVGG